jgi:hypothetical protein
MAGMADHPHTIDRWDDATGENLVEQIAAVGDYLVALETYRAAVKRWPKDKITLRNRARNRAVSDTETNGAARRSVDGFHRLGASGRILKRDGKLTVLSGLQVVADARASLERIRKRARQLAVRRIASTTRPRAATRDPIPMR